MPVLYITYWQVQGRSSDCNSLYHVTSLEYLRRTFNRTQILLTESPASKA